MIKGLYETHWNNLSCDMVKDVHTGQTQCIKKNRLNSCKIKGFGSYQTLYLTKSSVLRNRLLFIY
jgi:hypothetical protein